MPQPDRQSLRLVIQHVWESSSARPFYRLMAYGNEHCYRPVNFDTFDDLLKVLKAAMPEFDASGIWQEEQTATSIVFADVIELGEAQLSFLGLRE